MYQLHFANGTQEELRTFVGDVARRAGYDATALFHLYNDTAARDVTANAMETVLEVMPNALCVGCSTSGNICDGSLVEGSLPNLTVVCNVFEDPTAHVEVHQFSFTRVTRVEVARAFRKLIDERPWVKAVEILTTLVDVGMAEFCDDISAIREDVVVFGGAALTSESVDIWAGLPYVFSSAGPADGHAIVFVLYGGDNFHICAQAVYGWKPLGQSMKITRAEGPVLYELDGQPAYERYHHYLSIENDERFSENSIVFPLAIRHRNHMIIKAPVKVDDDGSLTLTSDMAPFHGECRITYGDPGTILRSVKENADVFRRFAPQGIVAFSCAARNTYWGPKYVSCETLPFQNIAPTAGFYTGSEFSRVDGYVLHHNVTLVVAGMREGDAPDLSEESDAAIEETELNRQMSIVNSLAAFIGVTSAELADAYAQMEQMAKVDGLTGVCNRREIELRIKAAIDEGAHAAGSAMPCVVMLDLDDFKKVNDVYGHKVGDDVLKKFGSILLDIVDAAGKGCSGRWGGEEFMVLLPEFTTVEAERLAAEIAHVFSEVPFEPSGRHTASAGVAQAIRGETADLPSMRADKALYAAKKQGKNCVVVV